MGTLLMLLGLGGVGGLGWWLAHDRSHEEGGAPAANAPGSQAPVRALPPPSASPEVPPPPWPAPPPASALPAPPPTAATVPSDFVPRLRGWLEQGPPATQIELVASHVERAGLRETATRLRALAADRRREGSAEPPDAQADGGEEPPPGPPEPASAPAPDGSPDSSPGSASDRSPSTGESSEASSAPSGSSDGARVDVRTVRRLARRVAAMLNARRGESTDRRLVRAFQVAARVFPERGETPSGLYGPATRAALARFGVRRPPRPRFRAEVEARPPRRPTPRRPRASAR